MGTRAGTGARATRHETAFLPAALEIVDTPPAPLGRAVLWSIVAFFAVAVAWAFLGELDIVAIAQGKIVPTGRVKTVQPLEMGVIRAIHVAEGDAVQAGQVLVEMDPTEARADQARLEQELSGARLDLARLRALLAALDGTADTTAVTVPPAAHDGADLPPVQRRLLQSQLAEFGARLAAADSEIARKRAAHAALRETVVKLEGTLPLVTRRVAALKKMADRKLGATSAWLELEQERVEQAQDLQISRIRMDELRADIAFTERNRDALDAEYRAAKLSELAEVQRRASALAEELVKATQRTRLQRLRAPVSGTIQQLAVHTTGGVVTPAQVLMQVVPARDRLEVEAWLPNKDIGFVAPGQSAEVKVETFPFTRYGTLQADIVDVSGDAVADDERGLAYRLRALLDSSTIRVGNRNVPLAPGMAVTVEVKTGTRRIIEYVLSPLLRGLKESARER